VPVTWRTRRAELAAELAAADIANADTEARFIVEEVSGYRGSEWVDIADEVVADRAESRLSAMSARRRRGEPLQYVLGAWAFRDLDLMVDGRVLIPRPETEWVVECALDEAERLGLRRVRRRPAFDAAPTVVVADLGTGSGAIALALEHALPDAEVWATDVSEDALAVASANAAGCRATRVRLASGSWFAALPDELRGRLALVVSNPPYVAESEVAALPDVVIAHEPRTALVAGPAGTEALDVLVADAPQWLTPDGTLVCEVAPHQSAHVVDAAHRAGFATVMVRDDLAGRPRVLVARRR
jgi:release factor glutamine methyltransferase